MGYERDVMIRARRKYQDAVLQHRQLQEQRRDRVYREYPRVRQIDLELRGTMAEVVTAAMRKGADPSEAIRRIQLENQNLQRERYQILEKAGIDPAAIEDGPMCRACSDTGYIGEKMCACFDAYCREEQRKNLTSLLSVPHSFDDFNLDYYDERVDKTYGISPRMQMEIIYETCVEYARKFKLSSRSLLMNGAPGLGKTFLSACIAGEVVAQGYSVMYDTAINVFAALERIKFGGASEEDAELARRLQDCDLLILDDLGTEMTTAFVTPALYSIVNGRILSEKPTIISTNLTIEEIGKRYSRQIHSRILGEYINLGFLGRDIRQLKNQ